MVMLFTKSSLLLPHFAPVVIARSWLARKVASPRVAQVLDKYGQQLDKPLIDVTNKPLPIEPKCDETLQLFDDGQADGYRQTHKSRDNIQVPPYTKAKDKKNEFKAMMVNLSIKKRRNEMNLIVLEGKRLINDAINANAKLRWLFFSQEDHLQDVANLDTLVAVEGTKLMKVLYRDMISFSSVTTSPGLIALAEKPTTSEIIDQQRNTDEAILPLTLIGDNIRDPGNLGTIIRTAAAAGVSKIVLNRGCVDAWNDKVIRSAMGAHFRIPLYTNVTWPEIDDHLPDQYDIYMADAKAHLQSTKYDQLQSSSYLETNFFGPHQNNHKVLFICNEAFGPSSESYQLVQDRDGLLLRIPLCQGIDSLNSAIATSVLLFEMRKQFLSSGIR